MLVTGTSSGIGLATTTVLLSLGANVFGIDLSPAPTALSSHANFAFQQRNLTDASTPASAVQACLERFGPRIDGLLNVAGMGDTYGSVDTLTDEKWDRIIATNLTAPVKMMCAVVPVMKEQGGGSIVNVASKGGTSGAATGVAYTASKHGLVC
jgi:NAD(P)-dependent dehydrogenase (short-subunit alcohol dehydrogenase family)